MFKRRHAIPQKNTKNRSIWSEINISSIFNFTSLKSKFILFFAVGLILTFLTVTLNKSLLHLGSLDSSSNLSNVKKNDREIISLKNPTSENQLEKDSIVSEEFKNIYEEIKSGDNVSKAFERAGLTDVDLINIVNSSPEGKELRTMFPGEKLEFILDKNNQLIEVIRYKSVLESIHFTKDSNEGNNFTVNTIIKQPKKKIIYRSAIIKNSLSLSAEKANISATTTMNMANIFGGVIDFVLDVRNGDAFTIVFEEYYLDGKKINDGFVIAAQYINKGKIYKAFRYTDPNGDTGYFNEHGVSMRKAFLRAPLDFTRVSSGFNMRRLHPITKQVKPHRGIDYAAPTGTPIFSTGDGRVIESAYNNTNGNYIFIRHGESYVTKYLHLHKRNVSKGERIKQGQIIGQVGSTGLSTGPHLHYEFLVDGVHHNPSTILKKLPKAKHLNPSFKQDFFESIYHTKIQIDNNFKQFNKNNS